MFWFYHEIVCCAYTLELPHQGDSFVCVEVLWPSQPIKVILMSTLNIQLLYRRSKKFPNLSPFASWPCAIINPQWLELPISQTNFHGPNDVRAIEVRLHMYQVWWKSINIYSSYHPETKIMRDRQTTHAQPMWNCNTSPLTCGRV